MKTLLATLLLILSTDNVVAQLNKDFGKTTNPVTTPTLKTREDSLIFMIELLDNAERHWRDVSKTLRFYSDSLKIMLGDCMHGLDLSTKNFSEVSQTVDEWKSISQAREAQAASANRDAMRQRKINRVLKTLLVVSGVVIVVETVILVVVFVI